ncbi:MAG: helix-turn-helix transcriptional regulator [Clostridia bacterium]|nr:helix-turn-helix transcriptional regulator [Clostridia bacterium]
MSYVAGLGLYIDTARFVPTNALFRHGDITEERTVQCYELVLFLKDGGYSVINGKKYTIAAGSVRFHRPGDRVYSYRFNEIYVIHFTVDDEQKGKEIFDSYPHFIKLPDAEAEIGIIKKLITALVSQNDFDCVCSLFELLDRIKVQFTLQQQNSQKTIVERVKKYVEEHFSEKITLEELGHQFHLHPVYLQRKFKAETHLTPSEYQKKVRISKAKAYLLTTDLPIDEVSALCGFCNTSYFINAFKERENVTPFKFRQRTDMVEMYL